MVSPNQNASAPLLVPDTHHPPFLVQAPLKIGGAHLTTAVTVLENQDMEFLLGLDMLKRHQCSIDLMTNQLKIGTTGEGGWSDSRAPHAAEHARVPECVHPPPRLDSLQTFSANNPVLGGG